MAALFVGHSVSAMIGLLANVNEPSLFGAQIMIGPATENANRLIADLLDFTQARVGAGLSITRTPIELHAVTHEAIEDFRMSHPGREIRHLKSGMGPCSADAVRLAQLLGNLMSNAAAHGDSTSPITVTSTLAPSSALLAVHNFGPGDHVFASALFTCCCSSGGGLGEIGVGVPPARSPPSSRC